MDIISILDFLGTFAFAISGALVAMNKKYDIFGVVIIAFVTALGGGMLRDVLIQSHPISWVGNVNYIWIVLVAVVVTFLFRSKIAPLRKTFFLFDTIGIGVFTLIGLEKCLGEGLHPFIALTMGVVSAVFGGVTRDILTHKVPLIFRKEIYALACFVGGMAYLLLDYFRFSSTIRILVVKNNWELPRMDKDIFGKE